jgi:nucleotide-binding universal stress UspA family protein
MTSRQQPAPRGDGERSDEELRHAASPLGPLERTRTEDEARERALETSEAVVEGRRRGRVEAEARRLSEQMTRQAQERLRLAREAPLDLIPARTQLATWPRSIFPIRHLFVPIADTRGGEHALPVAAALARYLGAGIALAHVGAPTPTDPAAMLDGVVDSLIPRRTMARRVVTSPEVERMRARLAQTVLAPVEAYEVRASSVIDGLLDLARTSRADLVVLSVHPRVDGGGEETPGPVARHLIREGQVPVLVVPPPAGGADAYTPAFTRVLVPLDGSSLAEQALAPVIAFVNGSAWPAEGIREIVLFSAGESGPERDDAAHYLERTRASLEAALTREAVVRTEAVIGSAGEAILRQLGGGAAAASSGQRPYDLLALATHGRSGFRRWLVGSVAEFVLADLPVPALVVRPAGARS